eukprot:GEMP01037354.1.p1 GENE.GEMP01037354.1~~GEMP01037354.1.p1  ORF type:complete len:257 (+),score=29.62 GEMP01037354.1:23-772(+)
MATFRLSPFNIYFSQPRIRPAFQDGRLLDDTIKEMKVRENTNSFSLECPFPVIEVIRWRPKQRNADGTPKIDAKTGLELYGREEWFSFDNRRLFCSQKRACAHLKELEPSHLKQAELEVIEVNMRDATQRNRELRKFRTVCEGRCVQIGHRDDPQLPLWDWREEIGLPPATVEEGSPLLLGNNARRGNPLRKEIKYIANNHRERWVKKPQQSFSVWTSSVVFLAVYCFLRLLVAIYRYNNGASSGKPST